jgi:hypothetical protein
MRKNKVVFTLVLLGVFLMGMMLNSYAQGVNMPKTIIHHVTLKWKDGTTDADKQKVIDELKALLAEVKGVKGLWVKSTKVQPGDFSQTFVIEFENQAALDAYAKNPKKKAWNDLYYSIREVSYNSVTTN